MTHDPKRPEDEPWSPDGKTFEVFVRPLSSFDLDFDRYNAEQVLRFVSTSGHVDPESTKARYLESEFNLFTVPVFVMPMMTLIREARANYIVGNFVSTIVLLGLSAELYADTLGQIQPVPVARGTDNQGRRDSQRKFLKGLAIANVVGAAEVASFEALAELRDQYMHGRGSGSIEEDARKSITTMIGLLSRVFKLGISDGKVQMTAELIQHMRRHGLFKAPPEPAPT
jgi:hypothetical protein